MAAETVQMQLIRRYARILREQQAQHRGPRIGARARRDARETAISGLSSSAQGVADAARAALDATRADPA